MIHLRKEGSSYKLGVNITFIWNKVSKSIEVSYHKFDTVTETSSLVGTRIRFNMKPFVINRRYSWNRVEDYLTRKSLVPVTKEFYDDALSAISIIEG